MIKKFISICVLCISFHNLTYAETFSDIKTIGNKRISKNSIIVFGDIKINKNYSDSDLNTVLKKLYETDFFKDVKLDIQNNILNIAVEENPIIENLEITGVKNKKLLEFLEKSIQLKNRKSFSETKVLQDLNMIKNISKEVGYYFTDVSSNFTKNEEQNSIQLFYNIELGEKAKINEIIFLGDKKFKDKRLLEIIASEEHRFWKFLTTKVYLNPRQIELDKRLLLSYYKNNGYYQAKITNSFVEFKDTNGFNLTYNIQSGSKYYFNKFSLKIPTDFDPSVFDPLTKIFSKLENKTYSLDKINSILGQIDNIATSRQYDFIDATIVEEIIDGDKINFKILVEESDKFYVDEINIFGNYATIEEVIRHSLIVDEGDPYNKILFNKSVNRIKSLNIFKTVKTEVVEGSKAQTKSINITVEEKPTGEISLAAGVGSNGSTIGGGIKENNFLGKGISLDTNLQINETGIKARFIYAKPNFNYSDNSLLTSLVTETTDKLKNNGYKTSSTGFTLGTAYEQYENLYFSPELSLSSEDLETNTTASTNLRKQDGEYTDLYFLYGLNYDMRNRSYQPTSGHRYFFAQELPLVSDNYELSNSLEYTKYKKLSKSSDIVGKVSFFGKAVNALSDANDVRISKRLFLPSSKLRGFEPGRVGPFENNDHVGGNYMTSFNASTSLPTLFPTFENIDFSVFFDAGNVWGVDYDNSIKDSSKIRTSTGLSMDILTPIGPLSFVFGQALTKSSSDVTESFRFNLGTTF